MVKVVERGRFSISIYEERGGRHHLPPCHVRWPDGDAQVELPNLTILAADDLPRPAVALLRAQLSELRRVWNCLNPERLIP